MRALVIVSLAVGLVGCDHATKRLAQDELRGKPARQLVEGVLELRYAENRDVAFSLLRGVPERVRTPLIAVFGVLAAVALGLTWHARRRAGRMELFALVLITAGGAGNFLDRLVRGYVVDFIHPAHYAIFNVADAYVLVGAVLLVLAQRRRPPAGQLSPARASRPEHRQ